MICISSNDAGHPVTKTFTTLHSTSLHLSTLHFLPFKLHPTTIHYPLIWLNTRDKAVNLPTHLLLVPSLKMSGVTPSATYKPSWGVKNNFTFF